MVGGSTPDERSSTGERRKPLVLVVDDDPLVRAATATVLRESGLDVQEAGSGPAALAALACRPVGAVLVDQSMPGMSGMELTRRLRAMPAFRMIPVLFFSADDEPATRLAALRNGATDFMVKPLPFDEVVARVHAQLRVVMEWESAVSRLEGRASTVADLAALAVDEVPELTAQVMCERISASHCGAGVAIYSWDERRPELVLMAGTGSLWPLSGDPTMALRLRGDSGPWIHYLPDQPGAPAWWACAPLRRGSLSLGMLALEDRAGAADELLAAVMDYASTAALRLGPALDENRRSGQHRELVRRLLEEGAFEPLFQPIVDLGTDLVVGYEALTRLSDGQPIVQFLAQADQAHIRPECELTLLAAALAESAGATGGAWLSVNLSPSVLVGHSGRLAELVEGSEGRLVIELTENERIEDYPAVLGALESLGERVRLSVDDTGSGYASLRHVIDLRPHFLKLDRSWISGLDSDDTRQAMVAGLVAFCRHTGTELIAEGIEREPERSTLIDLGVGYGQGYLLGYPAPLPAVPGLARREPPDAPPRVPLSGRFTP